MYTREENEAKELIIRLENEIVSLNNKINDAIRQGTHDIYFVLVRQNRIAKLEQMLRRLEPLLY